MFDRRNVYIVEDRNNNSGSGAGCLIALFVILAVIVTLILFAFYLLLAVIGIIMLVSAVIGIFYGIKNNVKAYSDSFGANRTYVSPSASKPVRILSKAFRICKDHMVFSWKANTASIRDFFTKSQPYRFLSFNKWMYMFSCVSVAVWGVVLSFWIIGLYVGILFLLASLFVILAAIICAIPVVIAIPLSLVKFFQNYTYVFKALCRMDRPAAGEPVYMFSKGFRHVISVFKNTFRKNVVDAKEKLRDGRTHSTLSYKRWIPQCTGVLLVGLGLLLQIVLAVLHALVVAVALAVYSLGIGFFLAVDAVAVLFTNKTVTCPNIRCNASLKRHVYVCECGEIRRKLRPSVHGIFKCRCRCGRTLPCTVFSGKRKMQDVCPACSFRVRR